MAAATTRVTTDETTDAATAVAMELDVAESDEGNPASAAVAAATRSYKQTGLEGEDADMTQRTSGWSISQLSTFCFIGAAVASQSGSQAPQLQSQPLGGVVGGASRDVSDLCAYAPPARDPGGGAQGPAAHALLAGPAGVYA